MLETEPGLSVLTLCIDPPLPSSSL